MPAQEYNFADFSVSARTPFDQQQLSDRNRHSASEWTIPEAYIALLLSAAMSDGVVNDQEASTVGTLTRRSRALRELSLETLGQAEANARQRLAGSQNWLQDACRTLPAEMCLPVFAHCADIVLADGELLPPEARYLEELAPLLDVPPAQARRIMEVLVLKARY